MYLNLFDKAINRNSFDVLQYICVKYIPCFCAFKYKKSVLTIPRRSVYLSDISGTKEDVKDWPQHSKVQTAHITY